MMRRKKERAPKVKVKAKARVAGLASKVRVAGPASKAKAQEAVAASKAAVAASKAKARAKDKSEGMPTKVKGQVKSQDPVAASKAEVRAKGRAEEAASKVEVPAKAKPEDQGPNVKERVQVREADAAPKAKRQGRAKGSAGRTAAAEVPEAALPPTAMMAEQIAGVLQEIAALLEILGENPFKVRAYDNAARILPGMGDELPGLITSGELVNVRGIGSTIAERVGILARTGKLDYHEELKSRVPAGLLDMLQIPGLGPKKVKLLFDTLDIGTVEALEQACRENRLLGVRGFGEKTQENILRGIDLVRRTQARFFWSVAAEHAQPAVEALRAHAAVQRIEVAGSLRRRKEIVHDVDIVVSTEDPDAVTQAFASGPWAERVLGSGPTKTSVLHASGLQMDLRVVSDAQFPYALHHFTGSKAHNIAMRGRAVRLGIKINEYGLFRGTDLIPCADEAEIFAALGLHFVPPELREDMGEIEAAERGELPARLIELGDVRGTFHIHTTYSDGKDSVATMVRAARERGWEYIGISDHSQSASAYGMSAAKALDQLAALGELAAAERGIRIFCGIEADILPDGTLDYPDDVLRRFDFVIASVHADFRLDRDTQTRRVLRAVENPYTTIFGHATSRLLWDEPGMDLDLGAVFEAAARYGVAVEINGQPQRMDPDGAMIRLARDKGTLLCIDPDAHRVRALRNVEFGVGLARRGWLEKQHVLNTKDAEEMAAYLRARRERAAAVGS